jgi:phytoene synthase
VVTVTEPSASGEPRTLQIYDRFEDLYRYCYLVASVVGLVCIRIFGYSDARAEELAEKTGLAFQLTNILRDVKEDAERGRVYLPLEDLERTKISVEQLIGTAEGRLEPKTVKALLALEGGRASEFYRAADELIPLLDRDSQAAMWVLVTIYRGLLERIEAKGFDVFTERASVPTSGKLWILAQGLGKAVRYRMVG